MTGISSIEIQCPRMIKDAYEMFFFSQTWLCTKCYVLLLSSLLAHYIWLQNRTIEYIAQFSTSFQTHHHHTVVVQFWYSTQQLQRAALCYHLIMLCNIICLLFFYREISLRNKNCASLFNQTIREYGHDFHVILMLTDIYHRPLIKVKKMLFF